MTPTTLAAALLKDVPRYTFDTNGELLYEREVLAALTAALDPAIAEKAGEEIESLRLWNRDDAADLITAALAQNAALRKERDASNELGRAFEEDAGQQRERAEAAEAQIAALNKRVEGLTGVLDKAANRLDWAAGIIAIERGRDLASAWAEEARAALSTTEERK